MRKVIFAGIILLSVACLATSVFGIFYFFPIFRTSAVTQPPIERAEVSPVLVETPQPSKPTINTPSAAIQPTAESTAPSQVAGNILSFEGVSFMVDPTIAASAVGQVIPEKKLTQDGPYWDVNPQYTTISLAGYPLEKGFFKPVISVYPVEEYRKLDPHVSQTLDDLKIILTQKPEDARQIPFLPIMNAGQVFHSNVKYMNFANGEGVRYLAIYAQYTAPVNNQDLFYTFQGLTSDERYFVSIVLPVSNPVLRSDLNSFTSNEMEAIMKDYDNYRADAAALLFAQPADSFTPSLTLLDALVTSLAIEK